MVALVRVSQARSDAREYVTEKVNQISAGGEEGQMKHKVEAATYSAIGQHKAKLCRLEEGKTSGYKESRACSGA